MLDMPRVIDFDGNLEQLLNSEGRDEVTKRIMVREELFVTIKDKEEVVAEERQTIKDEDKEVVEEEVVEEEVVEEEVAEEEVVEEEVVEEEVVNELLKGIQLLLTIKDAEEKNVEEEDM